MKWPIRHGIIEDWDLMEKFLEQIIFKYLRAEPEDHNILMVWLCGFQIFTWAYGMFCTSKVNQIFTTVVHRKHIQYIIKVSVCNIHCLHDERFCFFVGATVFQVTNRCLCCFIWLLLMYLIFSITKEHICFFCLDVFCAIVKYCALRPSLHSIPRRTENT